MQVQSGARFHIPVADGEQTATDACAVLRKRAKTDQGGRNVTSDE
jgi:hypothetical protein